MNRRLRIVRMGPIVGLFVGLLAAGSAEAATYWLDKQLDKVPRSQARYRAVVDETREPPGWPITIRRVDGGRYMNAYVDNPKLVGDYKLVGPYRQYRDSGHRPLIETGQRNAKGQPTGTITVYDRQGHIDRKVEYAHGKRNGRMRKYSEDGEVYRTTEYVDGKKEGPSKSFHHGVLRSVEPYRNDRLEGAAEYYYRPDKQGADGQKRQLRLLIHYKNGRKNGWTRTWNDQGQLLSETHYVDGKKDGVERGFSYDDDGERGVTAIAHYKAGKRVGVTEDFYRNERRIYADDGSERLIEEADINPETGQPLRRERKLGEGDHARTVTETYDRDGYLTMRQIDYRHTGHHLLYQFAGDGRLIARRERVRGDKVGRFVAEVGGGMIQRGRYDDQGRRQGEVIETRDGEVMAKSHYVDDERNGDYVRYDAQGRVIERGVYKQGKRSGAWQIHGANHYDQIWKGRYAAGRRVGHWRVVDENGRLLGAGDYDDQGEENGVWVIYDDDGNVRDCPRYDHGQRGDTPDFDAEDTPSAAEYCRDRLPDWARSQA